MAEVVDNYGLFDFIQVKSVLWGAPKREALDVYLTDCSSLVLDGKE